MQFRMIPVGEFHNERGPFETPVTIGRSVDADVQFHDRWVSRIHCRIEERDGQLLVRDFDSTHGTYVNGAKVDEVVLNAGDEFSVGLSRYRIEPNGGEWDSQADTLQSSRQSGQEAI